jgi:DNA invertase Pin-like site-specific DNA recombinase
MLTVLGGLAEFERELIKSRTGEGRARAKAAGVHMGRPNKRHHISNVKQSPVVTLARRGRT